MSIFSTAECVAKVSVKDVQNIVEWCSLLLMHRYSSTVPSIDLHLNSVRFFFFQKIIDTATSDRPRCHIILFFINFTQLSEVQQHRV